MKKTQLLALAAGALATAPLAGVAVADDKMEVEKCYGINQCKGNNSCAVSKNEIEAANSAMKNRFKADKGYSCQGQNSCSAAKGHLGWLYTAKGHCLKTSGGFMINPGSDGKYVVVTK